MELETDRLKMTELSEGDFEKFMKFQSHPDVMLYIGTGKPKSREEAMPLFQHLLKLQLKHGFSLSPIHEKETDTLIGFGGLVHLALDDTNPEIELGYWLLPDYWGRGYATEFAKACLAYAFEQMGLEKVIGVTHPENTRSQNVLKKAGLEFEGMSNYREKEVCRFVAHNQSL